MGFNFPNSPTPGQVYSPVGGYSYVWLDGVWRMVQPTQAYVPTAQARNRIVNGAMQHSQENGDGGSANAANIDFYAADQWLSSWSLGTGMASTVRTRPSGSGGDCVMISINTATATPVVLQILQRIEGTKVKDFLWGSANAKQVVVRFSMYSSIAGTFTFFMKNNAADRTFLAPIAIAAATWTNYSVVVPGDTTGVWPITTAKGMELGFGFGANATYGGGVAGWQGTNKIQIAGNTNLAATASAAVVIADVGLYLDPDRTGVAPPFVMPDEAEELQACQRYWRQSSSWISAYLNAGYAANLNYAHPTVMRIIPATAFSNAGLVNVSSVSVYGMGVTMFGIQAVATATGMATGSSSVTMNARM